MSIQEYVYKNFFYGYLIIKAAKVEVKIIIVTILSVTGTIYLIKLMTVMSLDLLFQFYESQ